MAESFLALITPVSGGAPTHPIAPGGPPPSVWPGPGTPSHPIYHPGHPDHGLPSQPPGIWGGAPSYPDIGGPPPQPGVWPRPPGSPGSPTHPIAPGGSPPTVYPPPVGPDNSLPPLPPGIWGGEAPPHVDNTLPPPVIAGSPEHPIALPPGTIWPPVAGVKGDLVLAVYVPFVGWRWIVIDTDLTPSHPIVEPPAPPTAQPKA